VPALDPLGGWPSVSAASSAYLTSGGFRLRQENRFSDATIRLAGPVVGLPGGPMTLTLLGETRREHVPASLETSTGLFGDGGVPITQLTQDVQSAYAELRAPLSPPDAAAFFLRGLELQLALRYDRTTATFPDNGQQAGAASGSLTRVTHATPTFTAGFRILPLRSLMLRASLATGELPPRLDQLSSQISNVAFDLYQIPDPKRGGRDIGAEGAYQNVSGGSVNVVPERARTTRPGKEASLAKVKAWLPR
jgi:outer membrane receptor protein involved in Fe transport